MQERQKVHFTPSQLKYMALMPRNAVVVAGRGGGKTSRISASYTGNCIERLPRSVGRLGAYTYEGILTNILPGILSGWEEIFGWVENMHYWVGELPPAQYNIDKPYRYPRGDVKKMIFLYNGTVLLLCSIDRGMDNGGEYDWADWEEVRLVNRDRLKEVILAQRGNAAYFKDFAEYRSWLMVTDRPRSPEQRWVLDYKLNHTDAVIRDLEEALWHVNNINSKLTEAIATGNTTREFKLNQQLISLRRIQNDLRKKSFMFLEYSTLENVHALGLATLEAWKRDIKWHEFQLSVLNEDVNKVADGFYAAFDEKKHTYQASNEAFVERLEGVHRGKHRRDCRWHTDIHAEHELLIAFDHNAAINNVVVAQVKNKCLYVVAHLYVLQPDYLEDLLRDFLQYFAYHKNKTVRYFYNHTSKSGSAQGTDAHYQVVINALRRADWSVIANDIGKATLHNELYHIWNAALTQADPRYLELRVNRLACEKLIISVQNADVRRVGDDYRKDKRSENKDHRTQTYRVPQEEATHASEALDCLYVGANAMYFQGSTSIILDPVVHRP